MCIYIYIYIVFTYIGLGDFGDDSRRPRLRRLRDELDSELHGTRAHVCVYIYK